MANILVVDNKSQDPEAIQRELQHIVTSGDMVKQFRDFKPRISVIGVDEDFTYPDIESVDLLIGIRNQVNYLASKATNGALQATDVARHTGIQHVLFEEYSPARIVEWLDKNRVELSGMTPAAQNFVAYLNLFVDGHREPLSVDITKTGRSGGKDVYKSEIKIENGSELSKRAVTMVNPVQAIHVEPSLAYRLRRELKFGRDKDIGYVFEHKLHD